MSKTIEDDMIDNHEDDLVIDCRILMVGDEGVGKSTIVDALLYDEFHERVPAFYEPVLIPPDVTGVTTEIVDYSTRKHSNDELRELVRKSHVICIVYSISDSESIANVDHYWLPFIQETLVDEHRPIIVAANKSDKENESPHIERMVSLMNKYSDIETVVECSAKILKNVSEIFFYSQKAVIYPFRPLFSIEDKELSPKCRKALVRIFKICDTDNDGLLSDDELKEFQMLAFGIPLTISAIEEVKQVLYDHDSQNIMNNSLTLSGFLFLHQMFIQRGRHETVWTVLKQFGYNLSLQLREDYLLPRIKIPKGCSVEPSSNCIHFIAKLFEKHDEDRDGCLSTNELQNLFSICPSHSSIKETLFSVESNQQNWVTYNGYINLWTLNFTLNLVQTLEKLAYLGFNVEYGTQLEAITITRDRRIDIAEKSTNRNVFQCHVIGPKGAGKTIFCKSLIGKTIKDVVQIQMNKKNLIAYTMNRVAVKDGYKHLLLHEVDVYSPNDLLSSYEKTADVICLLYDITDPHSFAYCATIYLRYFHRTKVPCLIVATKVEGYEVEQECEFQPTDFCLMHQLPKPVKFWKCDIGNSRSDVFSKLATMANYPHLTKRLYFFQDFSTIFQKVAGITAISALVGFLIYKNL